MGLSLLRPLPDPAQQIESLQRELYRRNQELAHCQEELRQERQKNAAIVEGVSRLRSVLSPLFDGLKLTFGEIDAMEIAESNGSVPSRVQAVWEDWKRKLPSGEAKAIDALLLHGKLKTDQIRIHVGCASRTAQNIVTALKSKGLVVKDGAYYSLKEL